MSQYRRNNLNLFSNSGRKLKINQSSSRSRIQIPDKLSLTDSNGNILIDDLVTNITNMNTNITNMNTSITNLEDDILNMDLDYVSDLFDEDSANKTFTSVNNTKLILNNGFLNFDNNTNNLGDVLGTINFRSLVNYTSILGAGAGTSNTSSITDFFEPPFRAVSNLFNDLFGRYNQAAQPYFSQENTSTKGMTIVFNSAQIVERVSLWRSPQDVSTFSQSPAVFIVKGSNDGVNYTTLFDNTSSPLVFSSYPDTSSMSNTDLASNNSNLARNFDFTNTTAYTHYRVEVPSVIGPFNPPIFRWGQAEMAFYITSDIESSQIKGIVDSNNSIPGAIPGALIFSTVKENVPGLQEAMRISHNGYVGIGTNNPTSNLHIHDDVLPSTLRLTRGAITDGLLIECSGDNDCLFINKENTNTIFFTNNSERMRINNTGYVGIGASSPDERLHVSGNIKLDNGNVIGNVIGNASTSTNIVFNGTTTSTVGAGNGAKMLIGQHNTSGLFRTSSDSGYADYPLSTTNWDDYIQRLDSGCFKNISGETRIFMVTYITSWSFSSSYTESWFGPGTTFTDIYNGRYSPNFYNRHRPSSNGGKLDIEASWVIQVPNNEGFGFMAMPATYGTAYIQICDVSIVMLGKPPN